MYVAKRLFKHVYVARQSCVYMAPSLVDAGDDGCSISIQTSATTRAKLAINIVLSVNNINLYFFKQGSCFVNNVWFIGMFTCFNNFHYGCDKWESRCRTSSQRELSQLP